MKKGFIGFLGLAIGAFMLMVFGCASTSSYKENSFSEFKELYNTLNSKGKSTKQGFIIEGYINGYSSSDHSIRISDTPNEKEGIRLYLHSGGCNASITTHIHSKQVEGYGGNDLQKRIDITKKHTIYIGFYGRSASDNFNSPYADKIIGLRTNEEVAEFEAQVKAEKEVEAEAKRKATEEERAALKKRIEENFIVKPSNPNFDPSQFSSVDLFKAVSVSKNLQRTSNETEAITNEALSSLMGISGKIAGIFVSDLVFVSQNGTDITFSTDDNAISQLMTIDQRSGLQVGQKVRVYYVVTRSPLLTWNIRAIERR